MGTNAGGVTYGFGSPQAFVAPQAGPVTQVQQQLGVESVEAMYASMIRDLGDTLRKEAGIATGFVHQGGSVHDVQLHAELKHLLLDAAEVLRSLDAQINDRMTQAIRGNQQTARRFFLRRR